MLSYAFIFARKIRRNIKHFRWTFLNNNCASLGELNVSLLSINKHEYSLLTITCVKSFLYWHPNSKVVVYCDQITWPELNKKLKNKWYRHRNNIQLLPEEFSTSDPWQKHKLRIILDLNPHSFFMDADLRWNGKIPLTLSEVYFFSTHESLNETSPFRQMLMLLGKLSERNYFMRNVSLVCFGCLTLSNEFKKKTWDLWYEYEKMLSSDHFGENDKRTLQRLIEQIVLSINCEDFFSKISSLKEIDRHMDGRFVESCYFDATGFTF